VPFRFTGTLNKLTFDLQPQQMTPEEHATQAERGQRNNEARGPRHTRRRRPRLGHGVPRVVAQWPSSFRALSGA